MITKTITGEITQEVLAKGTNVKVSKIAIVNMHASTTCKVDLYIEKTPGDNTYLIKNVSLPVGATLVYDIINFSTAENSFGLFIKLTKGASETPEVDIIIN
jgi:hypothetical protein|tara:strand:+ start:606 stop:908 length:303 start_codon:yes stop_codon:yes gene_type:complete